MKPQLLVVALGLLLLTGSTGAYQSSNGLPVDKPFPKAGTIKMSLKAGITGSPAVPTTGFGWRGARIGRSRRRT